MHSCVAFDSALNHVTIVVNGKKLEDKALPIPEGAQPPSNLTEKLLISKLYMGFWYQMRNKVSNISDSVNRFEKTFTFDTLFLILYQKYM